MAKSTKKRNKTYKPKTTCYPLGIRDWTKVEIPLLTALEAIGQPHLHIQHLGFIASWAVMLQRMKAPEELVSPTLDALRKMARRFENTEQLGATGDEMRTLKENVPLLLDVWREKSNYEVINTVTAMMKELERTGTLREYESDQELFGVDGGTAVVPGPKRSVQAA